MIHISHKNTPKLNTPSSLSSTLMASNVQNHANEDETSNSTPISRPFSLSNSMDSSYKSSSVSSNEEYPTFSPTTPLKCKGIPFSWEKIPGIPKNQLGSPKEEYSEHLLPLPPAGNTNSSVKKSLQNEEISPKKSNRFQSDPFFAALVECSKDDDTIWKVNSKNITRSLSHIFGFMNSCKRTCAVSESTVYLRPRPGPHYLLNRRSS